MLTLDHSSNELRYHGLYVRGVSVSPLRVDREVSLDTTDFMSVESQRRSYPIFRLRRVRHHGFTPITSS